LRCADAGAPDQFFKLCKVRSSRIFLTSLEARQRRTRFRYYFEIKRSSWKYKTIVKLQKMASRCNHKYRGATKDGHRGAIINIVTQQKMASRCNHKYRGATKDGIAVQS